MRKSIVSIILCLTLGFGSTAHALFIPAIVPVIAIGAGALIAAGLNLGVLYGMLTSDGTSHLVNSSGDISRKAEAKYIEIDMSKLPVAKTVPVHAKMPYDKVKSLSEKVNSDGSKKYPLVYNKSHGPDAPDISSSSPVGSIVATSWGVRKVTSKSSTTYCQLNVTSTPTSSNGGATIIIQDGSQCSGSGSSSHQTILYTTSATAPIVPVLSAKFVSNLGLPSGGGNVVVSPLQAEIDKMYQDSDYVPSFSDDTTGLPYSPPVGLPSPDQIKAAVDTYNRNGALADSKASVQSANSGAVSAAQGAADSAHAAAQQAGSASAANPGDAGLANAYADALARAAAADAALAKAKADQAKSDNAFTNMSASASESMPPVAKPDEIKSVDFSTLARLNGVVSNTFPLSMLTNVPSYLAPLLSGDVSAPQFDIPLYGDKKFHIDLTPFDPVAAVIRFIMALLISIGMILYVIRFWRGVS